ncbi:MFS transporter [Tessaracoccus rhinocerotis]|uniref:MFS transporter n=1 Tax=Tessaracoccus rhinocerotis TaxID=1689449 RepID=UPI001FE83D1A|nr:MFS transporter [Tessaracoccus rhinocerotis]
MGLRDRIRATGLPRTTWVLSAAGFLVAIGFGVVIPVLTPFARTFEANAFQLGLVVSMFAAMRAVMSPFAARIGRGIGERNAITIGMLIVAASTVATALAPSLAAMIVLRSLGGIGSAMFTISAINMLLASAPEDLRGRASGLYQGGFLLGSMGGPALGGLLGAISYRAPFYFYAVMLVVTAVFVAFMLPARAPVLHAHSREPRRFSEVLRDVRYQAACVAALGQGWQSFGVRNALIPILVTEMLLLDTAWTGVAFAVAAAAQTAMLGAAGTWTDRLGRKPILIAAGVICGLSTIAMPFAPNIWLLILVLCVYGVGAAFQGTAPTAAVADATDGRGGVPVAVFSMITDIGAIAGPLIAGAIIDATNFGTGFLVGGLILLLGAAYALLIPKSLDLSFRKERGSADVDAERQAEGAGD